MEVYVYKIIQIAIVLFAWIAAKFSDKQLFSQDPHLSREEFANYYNNNSGTYSEIMKKLNLPVAWNNLSQNAKDIFT